MHDDAGEMAAATNGILSGLHPPHVAEALGMREVLSWLKELNVQEIEIESDSL